MDTKANLKILTKQMASKMGCNWRLIAAIIEVESSWDPWAVRYEAHTSKYIVSAAKFAKGNVTSVATEETLQKCSWGLGQVMGFNCRSLGYTGPMPQICLPELGIRYACGYFLDRCQKHLELEDQIAAYNAGFPRKGENGDYINREYVDKVLRIYRA